MKETSQAHFRVLCYDLCGGTEEIFSENNWSPGLHMNLGPDDSKDC